MREVASIKRRIRFTLLELLLVLTPVTHLALFVVGGPAVSPIVSPEMTPKPMILKQL